MALPIVEPAVRMVHHHKAVQIHHLILIMDLVQALEELQLSLSLLYAINQLTLDQPHHPTVKQMINQQPAVHKEPMVVQRQPLHMVDLGVKKLSNLLLPVLHQAEGTAGMPRQNQLSAQKEDLAEKKVLTAALVMSADLSVGMILTALSADILQSQDLLLLGLDQVILLKKRLQKILCLQPERFQESFSILVEGLDMLH